MSYMGLIKKLFGKKKRNIEPEQTELEYLFDIYNCDNIETLEARCPKVINGVDVDIELVEGFKELIKDIQEKEIEVITNMVKEKTHIKSISNFVSVKETINN